MLSAYGCDYDGYNAIVLGWLVESTIIVYNIDVVFAVCLIEVCVITPMKCE